MLHTIQADFYRLFRSKGFWITELFLILNSLLSIVFGVIGGVGVNTDTPAVDKMGSGGGWTGFETISNLSQNFSLIVMFTIILASILIGVDISKKLYKNILSYGISRTQYVLAKSLVLASLVFFQILIAYLLSFILASLLNGVGSMPDQFIQHFLITLLGQFFCTCAWVSFVTLVLYLSHSIVAAIFTYFLGATAVSLLTMTFPDIDLFFYLNMQFNLSMAGQNNMVLHALLVSGAVILLTTAGSLLRFQKQDL